MGRGDLSVEVPAFDQPFETRMKDRVLISKQGRYAG
jgi:hypothetical protein